MSGTQADISITAGPEGAEDGLVKPTTRVLILEEASQVFTEPALKNFQSSASRDPELIEHIDAHFIVSFIKRFFEWTSCRDNQWLHQLHP